MLFINNGVIDLFLPVKRVFSMKFASFGRERDKDFIRGYNIDEESRDMLLRMTDAVHDLNDGTGDLQTFLDCVRAAVASRNEGVRDKALTLLARVSCYHPPCESIWWELADHVSWGFRFAVACRLYWYVPERLSDRLFANLRNDKSKRVREIAISRYENRADESGKIIFGKYDAELFDKRVRCGEVKVDA